jgi:hypothetical protein
MSHPSIHDASWCAGPLLGSLYLLAFKQLCRHAMLLTHGIAIVRQHMKKQIYYALGGGDDGTFMTACYIGTRYVLWKFPPSPLHTHTHTHERKINPECSDQKNWMLNMLSKTHFDNYAMQKKKIHEANTNHKHGLQE